ncbi:nucleotidyltransferase family protein [Paenibacillus sp. BR2-3]|uniref:nucleotidyltransferase family protein n=1 Tax=Paenibacillus sp. BR2-3 TaxID=3048494 RepID=UPI003977A35A
MEGASDVEYKERLIDIISRSRLLMPVFETARLLTPHPYYIGAGCLVQTVWNELTGREADYGIADIDIIYYDGANLSYAGEDAVITKAKALFDGIPVPIDLKNQARVHLWYRDKFGIDLQPYDSLEHAIDTWPTTATCLGARLNTDDSWHIYAPFGLGDLFELVIQADFPFLEYSIRKRRAPIR